MAYCEQCAALQRQNDFLANDRDGYVQLLTDENNKIRAEVEKLRAMTVKADEAIARQQQDLDEAADQAADCDILRAEVERLRAGNDDMRHTIHQWQPNMHALRAEIERLKAIEADYDDHERELIELEEDNARLTSEVDNLKRTVIALETLLRAALREIAEGKK